VTGSVLDVGTGTGRLAVALAPRARRVVGLDTDAGALVEARRRARRAGLDNIVFVVADAERADYRALGRPDVVVAHLCMSDAIVARAAAGLDPGGVLVFAAFHADHWRESGRVSRFAYTEEGARALLERAGFVVERMEVERTVARFASVEAGRASAAGLRAKWERDGRWAAWEAFLAGGGRTLTQSRLAVRARRESGR
jgi:SAM-dependent methyltransferase